MLAAVVLLAHGLVAWGLWHATPRTPTVVDPPVITANLVVDSPPPATLPVVSEAPAPATAPPVSPVPAVAKPVQPPVLASARPVATADVPLVPPVPDSKPLTQAAAQPPAPAATPAAHAPANPTPVAEPARPVSASPRELPMSAVRYLVEPPQVYPRASRDLGESGVVQLKVLVDEEGRPKDVLVSKGSGFPRLDRQAVLNMKAARFQPHVEAGVPRAVWVPAEIVFNLE
ncbi:MAG: TonB family protein [Aquabacterium sp.]|nr:TonB family protein [Aquabacterium sp.]